MLKVNTAGERTLPCGAPMFGIIMEAAAALRLSVIKASNQLMSLLFIAHCNSPSIKICGSEMRSP